MSNDDDIAPSDLSDRQFAAVTRALADPRRYSMLGEIAAAATAMSCCNLREAQRVSAATISHHIKELEAAGLIDIAREGKYAKVSFRCDVFRAYLRRLARLSAPGDQVTP